MSFVRRIPIFVVCALAGCSAPDVSEEALTKSGFTDIEITGWEPFSCGEDDTFSTGFIATNPKGMRVSGTVCCGMIAKDCTIRF